MFMQFDVTAENRERIKIRLRGQNIEVPSIRIQDRTLISTGKWLRTAMVHDEAYVEGELVPDAAGMIAELKRWKAKPDIFTFMQHVTDVEPRFNYPMEWDNFAVIPVVSYEDWLRNRVRRDVRENVRRSKREGVIVRRSEYDAEFVEGIKRLYDDTPVRQGKAFWHHGKSLEALEEIHGTYRERAEYIGAYFEGVLIGFLKMVYTGRIAKTMHVISDAKYHAKRPTNALIAGAVEACEQRRMLFLIYGEYTFSGNLRNSLTDFKRHNGFEEVRYPRYFVPLTVKGRMAMKAGMHRDPRALVPTPIHQLLRNVRAWVYQQLERRKKS